MTESELIAKLPEIKGEAKRELLLNLCEFRSETVDAFWSRRLKRPINGYLPYLCYSRSDAVSDHAADLLEHVVNKIIILKNYLPPELNEDAWLALNLSAFKQSDRLFEVLRKIGLHTELFAAIELDMRCLRSSETLPPFLRRQASMAAVHRCEKGFLPLLNDLLVCTYVRSNRECGDQIRALANEFPEAFGAAGFYVAYVTDQQSAYEHYGKPNRIAQVLSTFSGLEYHESTGNCSLYSPLWFYGVRNRIWHKRYEMPQPENCWFFYLTKSYCYADEKQRKCVTSLLFQFTWRWDLHASLREYFFHAALEDTTEENLIGMMRCGGYEMTESLIRGVCEMICQGRNHYHALFVIFDLLDLKKAEKVRLLSEAREYIESTDHRESWYAQRNHFLHAVTIYESDKQWDFD